MSNCEQNLGDEVGFTGYNWSYAGYQPPPVNRYLHVKKVINDTDPSGPGNYTKDSTATPRTGERTHTVTTSGPDIAYTQHTQVIDSDTYEHGVGSDDPDGTEDCNHNNTLSNIYPLDTFWTDAEGWWPGFTGSADRNANRASLHHYANGYSVDSDDGAAFGYDHSLYIEKLSYRFQVNKDPNGHLGFDEVFKPDDGTALVHHVQTWDTKGAVASPVDKPWVLDPSVSNNNAQGTYRVFTVELRAEDQRDGTGLAGSLVASNKNDGSGQKHFVSPQSAGGYVTVFAYMNGQAEEGMNFDSLYEFAPMGSNANIAGNVCAVKTDAAGKYTVQVRTKDSSHTVIASMNIWVVWAKITSVDNPVAVTDDGHSLKIQGGYDFQHLISPAGIWNQNDDIPNLLGGRSTPPPGGTNSCGVSLAGGADLHWDNSRVIREKFIASPDIPINCGDKVQPDYPSPNIADVVGNDDTSVKDEVNDPYDDNGILYGQDAPTRTWGNTVGTDGDTIEHRLQFQEFTRLEIAGVWYRISDPFPWRMHLKFKKVSGKWTSTTTENDRALDNANF